MKNDYCLLLMVRLLNFQVIKNCKSTGLFCRSILAIYTNDWSLICLLLLCLFSSGKFLNVCRPRTTLYPLWQRGPPGLEFYGIGLVCLSNWPGMVNTGWICSMRSEILFQMKFIIFQDCPTKQAVLLLMQPAPYNQILLQPL